eukprot:247938_1
MIKSITTTLFAIYSLSSGNRLLLQGQSGFGNGPPFEVVLPFENNGHSPGEMQCALEYTNPSSCAGKPQTFVNPAEKFKINCGALGACAQSEITLDYMSGGTVGYIEGMWCSETYSCYKTKVTVNNMQGGSGIKFDLCECDAPGACNEMEIYLNNVDMGDFSCKEESFCHNCWIYEAGNVGKPCFGW